MLLLQASLLLAAVPADPDDAGVAAARQRAAEEGRFGETHNAEKAVPSGFGEQPASHSPSAARFRASLSSRR